MGASQRPSRGRGKPLGDPRVCGAPGRAGPRVPPSPSSTVRWRRLEPDPRRGRSVMANTARDIMSGGVDCIGENETIAEAARKMAQLGVGALPICGDDDRLKGMVTDRDIVIKVIAEGKDPNTCKAGELAQGKPVTIGADDSLQELVRTMTEHQVKRLPVIDGHRLVGMVSESDVATSAPPDLVVALAKGVYATN